MAVEREFHRRGRPVGPAWTDQDERMGRMSKDRWSRWARGACEGYSLELGNLLSFSITRYQQGLDGPESWGLSLNGNALGSFDAFEAAVERGEKEARFLLEPAWADWQDTLAKPPAKRGSGRRR